MKRIVVEGMDSSGKSTLIRRLLDEFHFLTRVVNEKGPDQDFNRWWPHQLYGEEIRPPYVALHDRFFYSELVYGTILRGHLNADPTVASRVHMHLRRNALLIYCRPGWITMKTTLMNQPQMAGVLEHFDELGDEYDMLMAAEATHYGDRYLRYNWETSDIKDVIKVVEKYLTV